MKYSTNVPKHSGPEVVKLFSCSAQLSIKFRLLFQELQSMNIVPRLSLKRYNEV